MQLSSTSSCVEAGLRLGSVDVCIDKSKANVVCFFVRSPRHPDPSAAGMRSWRDVIESDWAWETHVTREGMSRTPVLRTRVCSNIGIQCSVAVSPALCLGGCKKQTTGAISVSTAHRIATLNPGGSQAPCLFDYLQLHLDLPRRPSRCLRGGTLGSQLADTNNFRPRHGM